jgi:hypothetical protein
MKCLSESFLKKNVQIPDFSQFNRGIHQTIQKNSVGFIPWDGITVGKYQIP